MTHASPLTTLILSPALTQADSGTVSFCSSGWRVRRLICLFQPTDETVRRGSLHSGTRLIFVMRLAIFTAIAAKLISEASETSIPSPPLILTRPVVTLGKPDHDILCNQATQTEEVQ